MSKNSLDARAVVHGEVKTDYRAVAPAYNCYTRNIEMVKDGDCVAGEVVVVKSGEVYVRASAFTASAGKLVSCELIELLGLLTLEE